MLDIQIKNRDRERERNRDRGREREREEGSLYLTLLFNLCFYLECIVWVPLHKYLPSS